MSLVRLEICAAVSNYISSTLLYPLTVQLEAYQFPHLECCALEGRARVFTRADSKTADPRTL